MKTPQQTARRVRVGVGDTPSVPRGGRAAGGGFRVTPSKEAGPCTWGGPSAWRAGPGETRLRLCVSQTREGLALTDAALSRPPLTRCCRPLVLLKTLTWDVVMVQDFCFAFVVLGPAGRVHGPPLLCPLGVSLVRLLVATQFCFNRALSTCKRVTQSEKKSRGLAFLGWHLRFGM